MKQKEIISRSKVRGWTERRLFNRFTFFDLLVAEGIPLENKEQLTLHEMYFTALQYGMDKERVDTLLDRSAKPMFAGNALWGLFFKLFSVDLKIPFLFGNWTKLAIKNNLIVTRGKEIVVDQTGGTTTAPVTAVAIGTGTVAPAAGDTALGAEITTGGGARGAATVTNITTTTTNDTEQWVKTFNFTASFAVTEEGLFDNNTSGGNMLARNTFSAVNVVNGDSLQITHKVQAT